MNSNPAASYEVSGLSSNYKRSKLRGIEPEEIKILRFKSVYMTKKSFSELSGRKSVPTDEIKLEKPRSDKKRSGFANSTDKNIEKDEKSGISTDQDIKQPQKPDQQSILFNNISNFIEGYFDHENFEKIYELFFYVYDFAEWLNRGTQQTAVESILTDLESKLTNYYTKYFKENSNQTLAIDGYQLEKDQLKTLIESMNLLQIFQNFLINGLEVDGRVVMHAWQTKNQMFTINETDDAETVAKKTNLIGFTNNRLTIYSVTGMTVALIFAYVFNNSNPAIKKLLDINELPLLLRYLIEDEKNSLTLGSKIISLASFHKLYVEIMAKIETYESIKEYLPIISDLKERFDTGSQTFNEFNFNFGDGIFNPNVESTRDKNNSRAAQILSSLEFNIDVADPKDQANRLNDERIRRFTSLSKLGEDQKNTQGFLLLLIEIMFKPRKTWALEKIDSKVSAVFDGLLFPLTKNLEKKQAILDDLKLTSSSQDTSPELQDLEFLESNLFSDLDKVLHDYSLPKYIAILHEVRYNVSFHQTFDLLQRLGLVNPKYKTINLNNPKARQFWLKSINSQITAKAGRIAGEIIKNKNNLGIVNETKLEIENYISSLSEADINSLILDLNQTHFEGSEVISSNIYDLLEHLESKTNLVLSYKYDGKNYSHSLLIQLNKIINIRKTILVNLPFPATINSLLV